MFSRKFSEHPSGLNPQSEMRANLEAAGKKILDLTLSNPTAVGIPYPPGITGLFDSQAWLQYQPSSQGLPAAREAISVYYRSRGREVDPEDLILTASTSEAYSYLF